MTMADDLATPYLKMIRSSWRSCTLVQAYWSRFTFKHFSPHYCTVPDWLDVSFWQAKIMENQYIGLPKSGHAKVLARSLGIYLV